MDFVYSFITFILFCWLLRRLLRPRDVLDLQLGVMAAFGIGYYCLPVWFKGLSPLSDIETVRIAEICLINLGFITSVMLGVATGRRLISRGVAAHTPRVDALIFPRFRFLTVIAFAGYIAYASTTEQTSYSSTDVNAFFNERGPLSAILSTFAGLFQAWICYALALAWKRRKRLEVQIYLLMFGVMIVMLVSLGQRLVVMTPIMMLMASLALLDQAKRATLILATGIAALFLLSPFAIYIRSHQYEKITTGQETSISDFSYGDNPLTSMFQSIIDRGDLIYVSTQIKPVLDANPLPGPIYYLSVLVNPIPKYFLPGGLKPYPLSVNGLPSGELSISAWKYLHGGLGSLSAFGGIYAYQEFRWAGVILNGVAAGIFFVFVARWLGGGGLLMRLYFVQLFVQLSVAKVPPSLFEALYALMPKIPFLLAIILFDLLLRKFISPPKRYANEGELSNNTNTRHS